MRRASSAVQSFVATLRRIGDGVGILVPQQALDVLHLGEGDDVEIALSAKRLDADPRFEEALGSVPGLGPFFRERKERF